MITPDIAVRDVLIGYRTRPRVASRFGHRSSGGWIHHYLATLHPRLYSPPADHGPLPTDLDELRLWALAYAGEHQQEAVLDTLSAQLPHTVQLLKHPLHAPSLPAPSRAWLHEAERSIRQLSDQIHRVSPAFALPHAPPEQTSPTTAVPGSDPAPQDITRALADFISPDIAPDDVLLSFRPHPRTGGRFTARDAPATVFGPLLHARLHGLEAAATARPEPWEEPNRSARATAGQQAAALAWLSGQLHSAGDILTWARHESHWRRLPRDIHAQLGSTATTVRELANGISTIPAPPGTALTATPVLAPPTVPSPAPPRR
ncbi:hypothetical protein GCM10010211_19670 [Streptomyces albospinus]|uniref:Uncharacterized protein n=1 Tax=Streptomyces albospinus TaxID=285515 RepID=A0ABQ2UWF1_9ACTN|nr:hypothetical protein [Streptomyces albospinus]GGU55052.1 hypothetical protein GCM10010211_19670 [Streptomyces albospinus]